MLNQKTYSCGICKTTPDQISHHKSHIETQKHKDKRELFELKLSKLSNEELEQSYETTNINDIIIETETIIYTSLINNHQNVTNDIKLKQKTICKVDNIENMNNLKIEMIEQTNSVSNKEALKEKIHEIHNFLRNNGAGYGMNALKVFNILYGLKKIEENSLLIKVNLKRPDCEFSYLLKLSNENKDEQLAELIFGNVLQSICDSELKELLFYEIPQNIRGSVFAYLIKEIDKITIIEKTCNVLLSGKIYEYFIGRDESAISELGAYFTDRHIVEYILSKLEPSINPDGTISSMIDMFGGSGGFTTGYIHYLNEKYPKLINWATEINKIYHFDMNEDVIKSAGLEFFCLTGVLPNMNNLKYKNSFTDEFNGKKFKYPLTNPPYGGDKNNKTEAQNKREKVKEFIKNELQTISDEGLRIRRQKQLKNIEAQEKHEKKESDKTKVCIGSCSARIQKFAKEKNIKGNDKESCSLMLLMDILEVGGTAIGVLKEGVFFNKTYKDTRKCLIENFNVREVISVPQDQFENTSTKTSIVIFDNTDEKTTEVKFSDLVVEKYTEDKFAEVFGDIVIVENKGDILRVKDIVVSVASKEDILENSICSLNGKDYNKKEINCGEDYKLVKLGDICNDIFCGKNLPKDKAIEGNYKVFGGGTSSYNHNEYNLDGFNILISRVGNNNISLINEQVYLTDNGFSLKIDNENLKKIIGYYLINKKEEIFNLGNGSAQKVISKTQLKELVLPIPKSEDKIKEWVEKISEPYNLKNQKEEELKKLEIEIQNKIKDITENEECEEVELGDICEIKSGKRLPTGETLLDYKTEYPYIRITDIINNSISIDKIKYISENVKQKISKYIITTDDIFITIAGTTGLVGIIPKELNNANLTENAIRLVLKNKELQYYIMYYLHYNSKNHFKTNTLSSTIPKLSIERLSKIKIKIPKNKELIDNLEPIFNKIETLQTEIKENEKLYNQFIQELSDEAIPQKHSIIIEPIKIEPIEPIKPINKILVPVVSKKKVIKKLVKKDTNKTKS
jgi:type I restriction enzyme S subunit